MEDINNFNQTLEEYKAKCAYLEEEQNHSKKIIYTLKVNGFDKDKIVQGLVNSGYVVGTEQIMDYLGRMENWKINIYG